MFKSDKKNSYQEFLEKKRIFAEKIKQGKKFKDNDNDGLSDYEEKNIYGTDPLNPDTDGDGMKDGDEVKKGRNPLGQGMLKDLFIPHSGNNYLPGALQPKRLFFHAVSLVAIKTIVIVFIVFYPLSAWLSPDMALAEAKKIIELTNNLRQAIFLPALTESQKLDQAAWQKVEDMAINQYFAHVSPSGLSLKNWLKKVEYKYSIAGENLAVGFSKPEDVVLAWKNSPTHYNNIIDSDFQEIGAALADGKYDDVDTAFIAQYFATPSKTEQPIAPASSLLVKGGGGIFYSNPQTITSESVKPLATTSVPTQQAEEPVKSLGKKITIDQQKTILSIKSDQFNKEKALQIEIVLPEDTVSAEVIINSKKIILNQNPSQVNRWDGASLISQEEEKNILNPLIPASITIKNTAGEISYEKIDWDEIKMIKTPLLEHYQLFKNNPVATMKPIINLSNFYFQLILAIAFISLLLNIFIEIKKQHPHIIFYSFAFVGLLLAMIVF